jgi:hypothetical protein
VWHWTGTSLALFVDSFHLSLIIFDPTVKNAVREEQKVGKVFAAVLTAELVQQLHSLLLQVQQHLREGV